MPSVADELAELRKRSLAKAHAEKLKDANGLSTPEQEDQTLKEAKSKLGVKAYKEDATKVLNAGSKAVDQDLDFKVQQTLKKKEDMQKKKEAAQNLQNFKQKVDGTGATAKNAPTSEETVSSPAAVDDTAPPAMEDLPDMDDVPDLESVEPETVMEAATTEDDMEMPMMEMPSSGPRVQNRAEKKSRKVMERLGMKVVPGISRVTLKMRGSQGYFTIHQPDVFEKNGSYIVFGEAKQGAGFPRTAQQQQAQAAQQLAMVEEKKSEEATVEEVEDDAVDETGLEAKDIDLVITQAGCSRAKAVKALKENDGDLVNAIMSLTS